ncbi:hypothetical protein R1flu_026223 [Riccia fluitans]|uniref:Retroviral polymerase SH3-like domain-containing protein n=1 Tax=Riccia fluitans TaxID=41844 RepID=A0ABD1XFD6_9MARC
MLHFSSLPKRFWGEAISTACYVLNKSPTSTLDSQVTPYQLWFGYKPKINHLRDFGCLAYAHVPKTIARKKLDDRSQRCVFFGYSTEAKAYRLMRLSDQKLLTSRSVKFLEHVYHKQKDSLDNFFLLESSVTPVVTPFVRPLVTPSSSVTNMVPGSSAPSSLVTSVATGGDFDADEEEAASPTSSLSPYLYTYKRRTKARGAQSVIVEAEDDTDNSPVLRRSSRVSKPPTRFQPGIAYVGVALVDKVQVAVDDKIVEELTMVEDEEY